MVYQFKTKIKKTLSDTHTPVELYLKLRDKFPGMFLLESSDYKSKENSFSYLCIKPVASFVVDKRKTTITYPDTKMDICDTNKIDVVKALNMFVHSFKTEEFSYDFVTNGLFGYTSYDAIPLFEDIIFKPSETDFPLLQYHLFRYLIVFNHFNDELYLIEHTYKEEHSDLNQLEDIVSQRAITQFGFKTHKSETSDFTDEEFLNVISEGIEHCHLGDVFQVVMSRKFQQHFKGDEFNVYRALRSINPSPYLFYFDYGNFKIFGSSPEAQLTIQNKRARVNPIAGTYQRTGNIEQDKQLA